MQQLEPILENHQSTYNSISHFFIHIIVISVHATIYISFILTKDTIIETSFLCISIIIDKDRLHKVSVRQSHSHIGLIIGRELWIS